MLEGVADHIARRPFKKYEFTGDYTEMESNMRSFMAYQANNTHPVKKTPCTWGDPLSKYMNSGEVREALHIPGDIPAWEDCKTIYYTKGTKGSQWIWEGLKGKYKMLAYSGDKDGQVPTQGTLQWINSLNRAEVNPWREWNDAEGQVGGYFWQLDGLNFSTIHGAGHMAAMDEGQRVNQLVFNWLEDKEIDPNWKSTDDSEEVFIQ